MVALRLLWIHVFAWFTVWLFSYWAGMEYIAAVLYLIIISREALIPARVPAGSAYYGSLVMAASAYLMTVILLTGWNPGQIYNYAIFILSSG